MYNIFKFSAQKVIDQKYFGKLNGQLNYANYIFKEKECTKENQFKGAGIYGVFLDKELIYVGKFQGQKKDWTRGNVVKSRWTKHVGTLTMLDKNVSFKPTIYKKILDRIKKSSNNKSNLKKLHVGLINANINILTKDMGCVSTIERFLISEKFWENNLIFEDVTSHFCFIYFKFNGEHSTQIIRNLVSHLEDKIVDIMQPIVNHIKKRTKNITYSIEETEKIFDLVFKEEISKFKTTFHNTKLSKNIKVENSSNLEFFFEKIENTSKLIRQFIDKLINFIDLRNDSSIEYIKYKNNRVELRIRKHIDNKLGFRNVITIEWQQKHQRMLLRSLLQESDLKSSGLKLEKKVSDGLTEVSYIYNETLINNLEKVLKIIEKAILKDY